MAEEVPFFPVADPKEFEALMLEAGRTQAAATIWIKSKSGSFHTKITLVGATDRLFTCWESTEFSRAKFAAEMLESGEKTANFNVTLVSANLFFKAGFKNFDPNGIVFQYPEKMFKVQRRQHIRVPLGERHGMVVNIPDPLDGTRRLERPIMDISSGGLSFKIPSEDEPLFAAGKTLEKSIVVLAGNAFVFSLEIRHIRPIKAGNPDLGFRVGGSFSFVKPNDSKWLLDWCETEAQRYYAKFL